MHPIAHSALVASIVTSALGAVILCMLVFRFGFTPDEDESPDERTRRFFATRLGHASGAVCFALTAGLAVVAGVVQSRATAVPEPEPAAFAKPDATEPVPVPPAIDAVALHDAQERTAGELRVLEARVKTAESALEAMRETAAVTVRRIERAERARERRVAATGRAERSADYADPPTSSPADVRPPDRRLPSADRKPAVPHAIQAPVGTFDSSPRLVELPQPQSLETPRRQPGVTHEPLPQHASVTRDPVDVDGVSPHVPLPSAVTLPSPAPPPPPARRPEPPRRLDKEGVELARQAARTMEKFADEVKDEMVTFGRRVRRFVEEELR
jgi:hypothetical protein